MKAPFFQVFFPLYLDRFKGGRSGEASFSRVVKLLEELAEEREIEEISLTPARENTVRLMNLHKAKGLEAPVVFLANPSPSKDHEVDKHVIRVGTFLKGTPRDSRPQGYFAFYKPGTYRSKGDLLSYPVGWEAAAEEEKKYQEAEEQRLMYVAATRARDMLIISTYAGDAKNKPWKTLDAALGSVPNLELLSPGSPSPLAREDRAKRGREKVLISKAELERARKEILANYEAAAAPTYQVETVTSLAKKERETPARKRDTGLGLSWGRLVHQILEAIGSGRLAAEKKGIELFIENMLAAEKGDYSDKERVIAHVMSIVESGFWQRIIRAERRHFEIPFSIRTSQQELAESAKGKKGGLPLILSGTIDLVFWEDNKGGRGEKNATSKNGAAGAGWVIVDYKTDYIRPQLIDEDLADLIKMYAPQIRLYTRFWQEITGEPVKEAGLYFTSIDRWVQV